MPVHRLSLGMQTDQFAIAGNLFIGHSRENLVLQQAQSTFLTLAGGEPSFKGSHRLLLETGYESTLRLSR